MLGRCAEVRIPHQRVAVVLVQLALVPAALDCSVHGSHWGSVKGSDLPAGVNAIDQHKVATSQNLERFGR
jgi:hypothetical protein